ncbi:MAG: glycosyltransferase [Mycoplasma sp.]
MNKILIVSPSPHYCIGGMETYNNNLINIFIKNGFQVDEYALYMDTNSKQVREPNKNVKQLNKSLEYTSKEYLSDILFTSKKNQELEDLSKEYDLVINSSVAIKLSKNIINSKKWVYVQHFSPEYFDRKFIISPIFSPLFKLIFNILQIKNPLKTFSNIIFFSDSDQQKVKNKKEGVKSSIYLSSLSRMEIEDNYKKWFDNKFQRDNFLYLGRICNQQKNIKKLVKLFDNNKSKLDLYGSGNEKIMNNTSNCTFFGKVDSNSVKEILKKHKFLVIYSKFEGFPFTIVEALSHGLPIITTDCFSCAKLLAKDKGFLIDAKSSNKIISKAKNISNDEYNMLVEECFKFSIENLSMENFELQWITYIKKLLEGNKSI